MVRSARLSARLALIAALAAAVGLSACGRKGGLEPPPAAAVQPAPAGAETGFDAQGRPVAAPAPKRHFFLDWLLN